MKNDVSQDSSAQMGTASAAAVRLYVERTRASAPTGDHWRSLSVRLDKPRTPSFVDLAGCAAVGALAAMALGWFFRPQQPTAGAHSADHAPSAPVQVATS